MAKNVNVSLAKFDTQEMREPQNFKMALTGEDAPNSAGEDVGHADIIIVNRRVEIQVSFNDLADAVSLLAKHGDTEGELEIQSPDLATTNTVIKISETKLREVLIDAQHNDYGAHIAIFVARYADGKTNPIVVT